MKKLIIVMIIVAVACTSVFAGDLSIGVSQGLVDTSFIASYEWDKFGVQGDLGFPLIFTAVAAAGAINEKINDDPEEQKEFNVLDFILPGAHVGAYWKAIDGEHFGWNLGLGGTFQSYFMKNKFRMIGFATLTSGLRYRFNDRFSMGLETSVPLALPLSLISEDVAKCTLFYYQEGEGEIGDIFVVLLGSTYYFINDLARISFKWSI